MGYVVLQKGLEPPGMEQMKQAFRGVPGLTPTDAAMMCKNSLGVLVRGIDEPEARQIQAALAAQGVETEVAEQAALPVLPQARHLSRVECTPDTLMIHDPLERTFPLAGKDILLIAAGRVGVIEFERTNTAGSPSQSGIQVVDQFLFRPGSGSYATRYPQPNYETHEEHRLHWIVEVVIRGGGLRYNIEAENAQQPVFLYLGNRRTNDLAENFKLLVQDLCRLAPAAAINRGAYYLREGNAAAFTYSSKGMFYDEMTWLLWKLQSAA
jgi:hypothetical protein